MKLKSIHLELVHRLHLAYRSDFDPLLYFSWSTNIQNAFPICRYKARNLLARMAEHLDVLAMTRMKSCSILKFRDQSALGSCDGHMMLWWQFYRFAQKRKQNFVRFVIVCLRYYALDLIARPVWHCLLWLLVINNWCPDYPNWLFRCLPFFLWCNLTGPSYLGSFRSNWHLLPLFSP